MPASVEVNNPCASLFPLLQDARRRTDAIFSMLRASALYERAIPERHRLIFYLGHLEAFDWNLLSSAAFSLAAFQPSFDKLFAFGIDPVSGNLPDDQPSDWPSETQIRGYNARVRGLIDDAISRAGECPRSPAHSVPLSTLLHAVIEHRLMHAETLAYLLHELPFASKLPGAAPAAPSLRAFRARTVSIPAGIATLGRARMAGFGWDNEYDEHRREVAGFSMDAYPVTNGEFLGFVRCGGYQERAHWSEDAWKWISSNGIRHPHFWLAAGPGAEGDGWRFRGMFAASPLPLDAPVWVSHAEASAYAHWVRRRLPSEAEWHRAAYGAPDGPERAFPWGEAPPTAERGNFDFAAFAPLPVACFPSGRSAFGVEDLMGNGWEWTSTLFEPFPGFAPFSFYPGYSADFFDGRHYVLKGGSPQTASAFLRRSFRNWFQPNYPYAYAKFRCVEA